MTRGCLFLCFFVLQPVPSNCQPVWSFAIHGGTAYNVPLPLSICQEGYPDLTIAAHFRSRAFHPPVYWDWRFTRWKGSQGLEFEAIHHKLYLENTSGVIQDFSISHGYNMLILNSVRHVRYFDYRIGGGIILAHPENTIRGMKYGDDKNPADLGYVVAGPLVNVSVGKPIYLINRIFCNLEARSTFSWAQVEIRNGHARLFNWAFQLVAGVGLDFIRSNNPKKKSHEYN